MNITRNCMAMWAERFNLSLSQEYIMNIIMYSGICGQSWVAGQKWFPLTFEHHCVMRTASRCVTIPRRLLTSDMERKRVLMFFVHADVSSAVNVKVAEPMIQIMLCKNPSHAFCLQSRKGTLFCLRQQQRTKKDKRRFRGQDKRTKMAKRFATRASSVELDQRAL